MLLGLFKKLVVSVQASTKAIGEKAAPSSQAKKNKRKTHLLHFKVNILPPSQIAGPFSLFETFQKIVYTF